MTPPDETEPTIADRMREIGRQIGDIIFTETTADAAASDDDDDTEVVDGVVTRYVIVCEVMDAEQRWLCTRSADASGEPLAHWDMIGLVTVGVGG